MQIKTSKEKLKIKIYANNFSQVRISSHFFDQSYSKNSLNKANAYAKTKTFVF